MDPQQRLLLEVVYEALEDGMAPKRMLHKKITNLDLSWNPSRIYQGFSYLSVRWILYK